MVKIRLMRVGAKKRPFYRVMAIDQRRARNGRALQFLGTYDPKPSEEVVKLDHESIDAWLAKGAQMSPTVASLVKRSRKRAALAASPAGLAESPAGLAESPGGAA